VRHRAAAIAGAAMMLLAVAGVAIWLSTRTHHGTANGSGNRSRQPSQIALTKADAYNPDGRGGTYQNNGEASLAIDGNPSSAWETETYYTGQLDKPGVGIYVVAAKDTTASQIDLHTSTPGFKATIYGSQRPPVATNFNSSGWRELSPSSQVSSNATIRLTALRRPYRYFLIWITQLPPASEYASVAEIKLYR